MFFSSRHEDFLFMKIHSYCHYDFSISLLILISFSRIKRLFRCLHITMPCWLHSLYRFNFQINAPECDLKRLAPSVWFYGLPVSMVNKRLRPPVRYKYAFRCRSSKIDSLGILLINSHYLKYRSGPGGIKQTDKCQTKFTLPEIKGVLLRGSELTVWWCVQKFSSSFYISTLRHLQFVKNPTIIPPRGMPSSEKS